MEQIKTTTTLTDKRRVGHARGGFVLVALASLVCLSTQAHAWTVINLHPAGATESYAMDVESGQQVGWIVTRSAARASLWSGTAGSLVSLHPAGASSSVAYGVHGGRQVGYAVISGQSRASLWSSSAGSWVDLHPTPQPPYIATESVAYGVDAQQEVGWVRLADPSGYNRDNAALWAGSASSWVYLGGGGNSGPLFGNYARAYGVDAGKQVGYWTLFQPYIHQRHAAIWSGTPSSMVLLNPPGDIWSEAYDIHGGQQVGYVSFVLNNPRASLWTGTASSWVNLHPSGASESIAYGVYAGRQVGYAVVGGISRASLWSGTAGSWVDLHQFLPAGFSSSVAHGIWENAGVTYVVGYGFNTTANRNEALMWVVPEPASLLALGAGLTALAFRRRRKS